MKSIKHKLWLAIFGMTALVIVAIWICQVVLLEQTYMAEKKTEIITFAYFRLFIFPG